MIKRNNFQFDNVVAFGCSYTFGEELPEVDLIESPYFKNNKRAVDLLSRRTVPGYLKDLTREETAFWYEILKNDYENPDSDFKSRRLAYKKMANDRAYPGLLASMLNINKYTNLSISGSSNLLIAFMLIQNKILINENSLVIIGMTHPLRKTKFIDDPFQKFRNIFLDQIALTHQLYNYLPLDDDAIIQELHIVYQIIDVLNKLNCSYIIYEPSHLSELKQLNDDSLLTGIPPLHHTEYCFLGHPGNSCHLRVATFMYEIFKND
jgi:hypothetical protein